MGWPTGGTRTAGVIGSPVRHSLSPIIHNAAFSVLGLDWAFLAFEVAPDQVPAVLTGARALGVRGLSVTMPLKEVVAGAVDRLTAVASALRAVNTVIVEPDATIGDNTDGAGFIASLLPWEASGRRCVVFGTGGAARAVVRALADADASDVVVIGRRAERAVAAAAVAGTVGRVGTTDAVDGSDLVVNATPVGMAGTAGAGALPGGSERLRAGQVVVDLVYNPVRTRFLEEAEARGATTVDGVGMLVHQAGQAIRAWTGLDPPIAVMEAAARSALRP